MKLFGEKIFNWEKVHDVPEGEKRALIVDAYNKFLKKVEDRPVGGQKIVGPDSNLYGAVPVALVMSDTLKSPDRGYEVLFDEVNLRQSTSDTFDVLDVSGGVTFYQQKPGEEAKLSKIPSSAKSAVGMLRFTGGLAILDDWLRFNKYYLIDKLFADTTRNWYDRKATLFYGLMAALTGITETYDTDDVTTINNACAAILTDLAAAGYAVDENSEFVITCNPKLRGRIFKAIAASFVAANANNKQIVYNIQSVVSTTKLVNTSYYVSLPGGKNMRGEWDDLHAEEPQRDVLKRGETHVWTGAYNGIIGEKKQHKKCALS